jgi:poly-gamma-glutamate synthesis protein (capsule biosynthesis protein)
MDAQHEAHGSRRVTEPATLFLCGDVMTGRGVDQILPHPSPPQMTDERPGVDILADRWEREAAEIERRVEQAKAPGDLVVASIHWGGNWGYAVPSEHVWFAHRLIDGGVDVVHGHSSHHVRPIEVYGNRLVLYGCGDFINDYEGIAGYEAFRDDLRLMYFPAVAPSGELASLRVVPMQSRALRLERASSEDARWLRDTICRVSEPFGVGAELADGGHVIAVAGCGSQSS